MSKRFGLDWKKYEHKRIMAFLQIGQFEAKEKSKDSKKKQSKFRKRM